MIEKKYGIHWFRRDLRIAGNAALQNNWKKNEGRVLGLFCFDSKFLSREDFSHNRFAFFLKTLKALKMDFKAAGGDLLVLDGDPLKVWSQIISSSIPALVTFNRDYEPFARKRDESVLDLLKKKEINVETERDHLILEPQEVLKGDGGYYQVYTPFAKRWLEKFTDEDIQSRVDAKKLGLSFLERPSKEILFSGSWKEFLNQEMTDQLEKFIKDNEKNVNIPIPDAGSRVAFEKLKNFSKKMKNYTKERDFPSHEGTSGLSHFFKNGSLTTAQVASYLGLGHEGLASESGGSRFLKELIWREFYYSILWHEPRVEKEAFIKKYNEISWKNDRERFKRWCEGTTGFPIVDAGMRQLNSTGWMHNRVRMIVASFLTKDLLIDWRWGEKYFMNKLLDGDLAPNNGGWQWAASTGCDPQPYFRIFNPYLQSEKFDPDGSYIRKFVPELRQVKGKAIHCPEGVKGYPEPIVDHATQRGLAVGLYKEIKSYS